MAFRAKSGHLGWTLLFFVAACGSGASGIPVDPDWPTRAELLAQIPSPERNPLTSEGVDLGRALFFDPLLSGDNQVSCATCHQPALGFADGEVLSEGGVSGEATLRHSPALLFLAWMDGYFWDGGGSDLESQAFAPLVEPTEMGQDLDELMEELAAHPTYPARFEAAFEEGLTLANVVRALAQFQRTLISVDAPFDRVMRGEDAALSPAAARGYAVFAQRCAACHGGVAFTDHSYRNNGLDASFPDDDVMLAWGRGRITMDPADKGKFKVPSLRNVTVTSPYMHDGRFATLSEVIDHYRSGVRNSPTLDPLLRRADGALGLPVSDLETADLLAFLDALTDLSFLNDPDYAAEPALSAGVAMERSDP